MKRTRQPRGAIDVDGTLAMYDSWKGLDNIGKPCDGAAQFLRDLRTLGVYILIYTTRTKLDVTPEDPRPSGETVTSLVKRIEDWCDGNGLLYDEVYAGQGKPAADFYLDDRAVLIPKNPQSADFSKALRYIMSVVLE